MKKYLLLLLTPAIFVGCSNVRTIGVVNGVTLTRVTARGVFSPATTTIIASNPNKTGELEVLSTANGPGVLPAVATAGGVVGGAALLRPARTSNDNSTRASGQAYTSSSASAGAGAVANNSNANNANGGNSSGGFVPPGHAK